MYIPLKRKKKFFLCLPVRFIHFLELCINEKFCKLELINCSSDIPQPMMVWLTTVWLHDGVKATCSQWKPYFAFWTLIFSQASDVTPLACYSLVALGRASSSQPGDHECKQPTLYSELGGVFFFLIFGFCVFTSHHVYKMPVCLLLLMRRRGRWLVLRWKSKYLPKFRLSTFKVGEAQLRSSVG